MGLGISYCGYDWYKEKITVTKPIFYKTYLFKDFDIEEEFNSFTFSEHFCDFLIETEGELLEGYKMKYIDVLKSEYIKWTIEALNVTMDEEIYQKMIDKMKEEYDENSYIVLGDIGIHFVKDEESVEKMVWKAGKYVNFNECDKAMFMSLGHLETYGLKLENVYLSRESLEEYTEGTKNGNYVDKIINTDTTHFYEKFKNMLENMENVDNSEFFEVRKERYIQMLPVFEKGAKIVYG